jgi:hypothetical protein
MRRDQVVAARRHPCSLANQVPERRDERDGKVRVHATEETVGPGTMPYFASGPDDCRGGTKRPRFDEHILRRNHGDGRPDLVRDVAAGNHQDSLVRDQRLQARDGLSDERTFGHEREDLFGARGRRERPEAGADTTGQDYRPQLLVNRRAFRREGLLRVESREGRADGTG